MTQSNVKQMIVTPIGRVSFPHVFEMHEYQGRRAYEITLLFPPDANLSQLKKAVEKSALEAHKGLKRVKLPFKNAGEKDHLEGYQEGWTAVTFRTQRRPVVIGPDKWEISEESGQLYPGCWARVTCDAYAWNSEGTLGVSLGLGNVQKCRDDEPLGSSGPRTYDEAAESFDEIDNGAYDEIPF